MLHHCAGVQWDACFNALFAEAPAAACVVLSVDAVAVIAQSARRTKAPSGGWVAWERKASRSNRVQVVLPWRKRLTIASRMTAPTTDQPNDDPPNDEVHGMTPRKLHVVTVNGTRRPGAEPFSSGAILSRRVRRIRQSDTKKIVGRHSHFRLIRTRDARRWRFTLCRAPRPRSCGVSKGDEPAARCTSLTPRHPLQAEASTPMRC